VACAVLFDARLPVPPDFILGPSVPAAHSPGAAAPAALLVLCSRDGGRAVPLHPGDRAALPASALRGHAARVPAAVAGVRADLFLVEREQAAGLHAAVAASGGGAGRNRTGGGQTRGALGPRRRRVSVVPGVSAGVDS